MPGSKPGALPLGDAPSRCENARITLGSRVPQRPAYSDGRLGGCQRGRPRSQAYSKVLIFRWSADPSRRGSASAGWRGTWIRLVGGSSGLSGRMRGVLSACGRGCSSGVAHRGGGLRRDAALSRTAGPGRRRGPPAAGQRSAGWRGAGRRSGPRGARWRWRRWSGRRDCAADCPRAPGSGPRRR